MRKIQILRLILRHYKTHLKYISENFINEVEGLSTPFSDTLWDYLNKHHIVCGICSFLNHSLTGKNSTIAFQAGYKARWIADRAGSFGNYPGHAATVGEAIRSLETRIYIVEDELKEGKNLYQRVASKNYCKS